MTKLEANLIADCLLFVEVLIFWRVMFLVLKKNTLKLKLKMFTLAKHNFVSSINTGHYIDTNPNNAPFFRQIIFQIIVYRFVSTLITPPKKWVPFHDPLEKNSIPSQVVFFVGPNPLEIWRSWKAKYFTKPTRDFQNVLEKCSLT